MDIQERTKILLAVSESSIQGYPHPSISSRRAFEWIVESILRSNPHGFRLSLLHVHPPANRTASHSDQEESLENHTDGVELLQYFVNRCIDNGVIYEVLNMEGDNPKKVICREVNQRNPDMLVMGSRRPTPTARVGGFRRFFKSGVNKYCLKHAKCTVVTVKRRMDDVEVPLDD